MAEPTIVSTEQLRSMFDILAEHLESTAGREIALRNDYFWSISDKQQYDVYNEPAELTIGQLSETWGNLQQVSGGESDPINYALVWLGDLLRAIGQQSPEK